LISTLAICVVFVSVFFLQGAARHLFTPLAMAVVFAMLASYGISRTLTPIIIRLLLRSEHGDHRWSRALSWRPRLYCRCSSVPTSFPKSTPDPAACPRPGAHPYRTHGPDLPRDRREHPTADPSQGSRPGPGQYRPAVARV
jgi:hypothetical protein